MRDGDVDLDTPSDFTASSLSYLDSVLRCPICSELYTAPVILTNCLHTFCSLCLRCVRRHAWLWKGYTS